MPFALTAGVSLYKGIDMSPSSEISLINIEWPIALLQCNRELIRMQCGDKLDVLVDDPDVARDLLLIIEHSENHSATFLKENGQTRITVTRK